MRKCSSTEYKFVLSIQSKILRDINTLLDQRATLESMQSVVLRDLDKASSPLKRRDCRVVLGKLRRAIYNVQFNLRHCRLAFGTIYVELSEMKPRPLIVSIAYHLAFKHTPVWTATSDKFLDFCDIYDQGFLC